MFYSKVGIGGNLRCADPVSNTDIDNIRKKIVYFHIIFLDFISSGCNLIFVEIYFKSNNAHQVPLLARTATYHGHYFIILYILYSLQMDIIIYYYYILFCRSTPQAVFPSLFTGNAYSVYSHHSSRCNIIISIHFYIIIILNASGKLYIPFYSKVIKLPVCGILSMFLFYVSLNFRLLTALLFTDLTCVVWFRNLIDSNDPRPYV